MPILLQFCICTFLIFHTILVPACGIVGMLLVIFTWFVMKGHLRGRWGSFWRLLLQLILMTYKNLRITDYSATLSARRSFSILWTCVTSSKYNQAVVSRSTPKSDNTLLVLQPVVMLLTLDVHAAPNYIMHGPCVKQQRRSWVFFPPPWRAELGFFSEYWFDTTPPRSASCSHRTTRAA